jgi:catechol 2,3-dioxygenase-like lactoylglutathione lyase family enzyme
VQLWYRVSDVEAARDFYTRELSFREVYFDPDDRWVRLERNGFELALAEGEFSGAEQAGSGEGGAVATIDVDDVKAEAERLRDAGVNVGTVVEIPGTIRLLDVFDPDGNRLQLAEDIGS